MRCTGACCASFTLADAAGSLVGIDHLPEAHPVRQFFRLREVVDDGDRPAYGLFDCASWDRETRRCTRYEDRPDACREYPHEMRCRHCGALSSADARGVALVLRSA